MERLTAGSPELDRILHGGFPENSINVVMGQPGTGKTVLAQSLAWRHARGARPVLYCTTLAEPLSKLVRYAQGLDFFEPSLMGNQVFYEDLGEPLTRQGLAGLNSTIRDKIKEKKPAILVIDSFKAAQDLGASRQDIRRTTFELAGLLSAYDVTAFLIGEYHEREIRESPIFAAADGVVELSRALEDRRESRHLRVLKLRGSDYLGGLHDFTITSAGLSLRLPPAIRGEPAEAGLESSRAATGIPGLDALLGGGVRDREQTLLLASPGGGKTTMGLQFALEGARGGESSLFVSLAETPPRVEQMLRRLDPELEAPGRDRLHCLFAEPVDPFLEGALGTLLEELDRRQPGRVVLDGIGDSFAANRSRARLQEGTLRLVQAAGTCRGASLVTGSLDLSKETPFAARINAAADNILLVDERPGVPERLRIRVRKCRFATHERRPRTLELWERGARVLEE